MQTQLLGMMSIVILLGITSAIFFKILPLPYARRERIITHYLSLSFILSSLAFMVFVLGNVIPRAFTIGLNSALYIASLYCLRHGLLFRKEIDTPHLYYSPVFWLNVVALIIINSILFHYFYDSQLMRALTMFINISLLLISIARQVSRTDSPTRGERIVQYAFYFSCVILVILPLSALIFGSHDMYLIAIIIAQSLQVHIILGTLCALMLSDIVNLHYHNSITDSMTQLHNRRYFMRKVNKILAQQPALPHQNIPTNSLITCDIDRFKPINDTYGHDVGDKVIISFGEHLRHHLTKPAILARIGGEEFAIFLQETDEAAAADIATQLCESLQSLTVPIHDNEVLNVTASFGVASLTAEHVSTYLKAADQAMYASKTKGRNCVSLYAPPA